MPIRLTSTPPEQVCIVRLSAIGDTCHTLPVVRTLQSAWPDTRLTWIIGRVESTLLGDVPGIEFIIFDKNGGRRARAALRKALRGRHFDVLLHMHASMRANLASRCVRADVRLGFDRARARDFQWLFCNARIEARPNEHVMDGLFGFAEALGVTKRVLRWDLPLSDSDRAFALEHIPDDRPTLILSPCSSQRFRNFRNWSAENYATVVDHAFAHHGMRTILTGGATALETDYGARISAAATHPPGNLIGETTLKQLVALLARARLVVCPDSGPAHMATAVGTPVLGLYATSNRFRTGPYFSQDWVVDRYPDAVRAELGKDVSALRWGARVRNPDAMALIQVGEVTERLDSLIAAVPPTR